MPGHQPPRGRSTTALLFALLVSTGSCAQPRAEDVDDCPGASAWHAAHADQSPKAIAERDAHRPLSDPALLAELEARADRDQTARRRLLAAPLQTALRHEVADVDARNLTWLVAQLRSKGIPTAEQVGEHGLQLMWLLVQHADAAPALQSIALGEFEKRFESHELPADSLARLTDRVLTHKGEPQRYGTQFDWWSGGLDPKRYSRSAEIDANRAKLGLMPLSDYACAMNLQLRHGHRTAQ